MRLLVVSHSSVTPTNQQIYGEIRKITGWEITLLVPEIWKDEFGNAVRARRWPGAELDLVKAPVYPNGNIIFHAYCHSLKRLFSRVRFNAVYVNHEPYGISTAQLCWANNRYGRLPFGFYSCQNLQKSYPPPFRWLESMVYRSSQFAFPITEAVAEVLRTKGYTGNLTVCPLPFDPELYRPRSETEFPSGLGKNRNEVLIGYAGRIVEAKGLRTLVEALELLPRSGWKLAVVGAGPFESELGELIRNKGLASRVLQVGFVPHEETPHYLAAFDLLVLPSETQQNWKEQFGRVILEALACGTPVIGSDSGEIPNLIGASGGGLVFPERNPAALAEKLRTMISNPTVRKHYSENGRQWALKFASLPTVAARMADAIERVLLKRSAEARQCGPTF
jgi:glycosyltransferase involved in cell wall biosynthesis